MPLHSLKFTHSIHHYVQDDTWLMHFIVKPFKVHKCCCYYLKGLLLYYALHMPWNLHSVAQCVPLYQTAGCNSSEAINHCFKAAIRLAVQLQTLQSAIAVLCTEYCVYGLQCYLSVVRHSLNVRPMLCDIKETIAIMANAILLPLLLLLYTTVTVCCTVAPAGICASYLHALCSADTGLHCGCCYCTSHR
jgi:hypothetical protein